MLGRIEFPGPVTYGALRPQQDGVLALMLRFMRRHRRSFIVKGVFAVLILVFIGWGVGSYNAAQQSAPVASVNGITITAAEFAQAQQNLQRSYQELYGAGFTQDLIRQLDVPGRALDELIRIALLQSEAQRVGLRVTDEEVAASIRSMGVFNPEGRFDKNLYLRFLQASQLTDEDFVEQQRKVLLIQRVENLITDGARVSEEEIRDRYLIENEEVSLRYVKVPWAPLRETVPVSDEEITAHFEEHQERYRIPERVAFAYVLYSPERLAENAVLGEDEMQAYYDAHLTERFTEPPQVQLRQLMLEIPAGADEEKRAAIRDRAQQLAKEARTGDFAELAREHSDHKPTAEAGGEVGWVARDALDDSLAEAAFAVEEGGVSDPVELPTAVYVLKVEGTRESRARPLDEVREVIETSLRADKGRELARRAADEDVSKIATGSTLEDVAAARGLSVEVSKPLSTDDVDPAFGPARPLVTAARRLAVGETSDAVETPRGFVVLRPTEVLPASVAALEDVRDRVKAVVEAELAKASAKTRAEELLAALRESGDLDTAAAAQDLTATEVGPFSRRGASVPDLGVVDGLKDAVFGLPADESVVPDVYVTATGDAVVAVVKERIAPDLAELEKKRDSLRDGYLLRKKRTLLSAFLTGLKQQADIEVRANLLPQT